VLEDTQENSKISKYII